MTKSEKEERQNATQATFLQFVGGFAVQTLVHLGRMSNPMSGATAVDLPNAKYSIDILAVLQEKTKGNLTPEEEEYLSNLLRDLRLEYVAILNKSDASASESAAGDNDESAPKEDAAGEGGAG